MFYLYQHCQNDSLHHLSWPLHGDVPTVLVDLKQIIIVS